MARLFQVLCIVIVLHSALFCASILWRIVPSLDFEEMNVVLAICYEVYVVITCTAICYVQTQWVLSRIQREAHSLQCDNSIFYNSAPKRLLSISSGSGKAVHSNSLYPTAMLAHTINNNHNNTNTNTHELPKITEDVIHFSDIEMQQIGGHNQHHSTSLENDSTAVGTDTPSQPVVVVEELERKEDAKEEEEEEEDKEEESEFDRQMYSILFITLEQEKLLDDLTKYLASEQSMECVYAFIEFTQYKRLLEKDHVFMQSVVYPTMTSPDHDAMPLSARYSNTVSSGSGSASLSTSSSYSFSMIKLPKSISKSSLVHNRKYARYNGNDRYRKVAKKLSERYLESGAEFELCINQHTKHEVVSWVNTYCRHFKPLPRGHHDRSLDRSSNWSSQSEHSSRYSSKTCINDELYHLFEQCRKEIYILMAHAGRRYIKYAERAKQAT